MDLVQLGGDDDRNVATLERERERLLRARQPGRHRDGDRLGRESAREGPSLLDPLGRETLARHRARRDAVAVRAGESVPGEEELAHA